MRLWKSSTFFFFFTFLDSCQKLIKNFEHIEMTVSSTLSLLTWYARIRLNVLIISARRNLTKQPVIKKMEWLWCRIWLYQKGGELSQTLCLNLDSWNAFNLYIRFTAEAQKPSNQKRPWTGNISFLQHFYSFNMFNISHYVESNLKCLISCLMDILLHILA